MPKSDNSLVRPVLSLLAVGLAAMLLAGCTAPATAPDDTSPATPAPAASASASATPVAPAAYRADGTALQNEGFFRTTVRDLLRKNHDAGGKPIIDALVAAGFPKKNLEVTPDKTSVGLDADNIEFSAKVNGGCIIGQSGNVGFSVITAPLLSTGKCLIGKTRTIDW